MGQVNRYVAPIVRLSPTLAITRLLRRLGSSADANSGGEIDVALRAGFIPAQVVFTGVGKTMAELAQAIDLGVQMINVESAGELARVEALSRERNTRTKIAIRINPDVDAKTHPHISTGLKINKFGIGKIKLSNIRPPMRRRGFAAKDHCRHLPKIIVR